MVLIGYIVIPLLILLALGFLVYYLVASRNIHID